MLHAPAVRALSIDLDDTLWPLAPAIEAAEAALHRWFSAHAPRVLEGHSPERLATVRREVFDARRDQRHDVSTLRRLVIERLLEQAGYPPALAGPAFAAFFAARNQVVLYDDVRPALERLRRRFPLVALTNGNACVMRTGIEGYFRGAVYARDVGAAKPARAMFEAAARALAVAPAELLHVGDHLREDVGGARDAGCQAVWINRRRASGPAGLATVGCLRELADLLGC